MIVLHLTYNHYKWAWIYLYKTNTPNRWKEFGEAIIEKRYYRDYLVSFWVAEGIGKIGNFGVQYLTPRRRKNETIKIAEKESSDDL